MTHPYEKYMHMKQLKKHYDMLRFIADAQYGIPPNANVGEKSCRMLLQIQSIHQISIPYLGEGTSPESPTRTMRCSFVSHGFLVLRNKLGA
ncbi:unnamed protein product [Eruca vesicaria subsp. sativa]|uniref:Uncharacterized protein n=1 Tax=Eruca vesicaria subsp. sativa TaxID=29727 RepID=A0ABC8KIX3_ERUVS|nr:unnamed protein product [Eruca vesicaria subsp. sativa]